MGGVFDKCINCEERKVGCHSTCEHYKKGTDIMNKARERRRMENKLQSYEFDVIHQHKK